MVAYSFPLETVTLSSIFWTQKCSFANVLSIYQFYFFIV
jgi:hypothetical protein